VIILKNEIRDMTTKPHFDEFRAAAAKFAEYKGELLAHMALQDSVECLTEMIRDNPDDEIELDTETLTSDASTYAYEVWFHERELPNEVEEAIKRLAPHYTPAEYK
jgi:hypothetical protein